MTVLDSKRDAFRLTLTSFAWRVPGILNHNIQLDGDGNINRNRNSGHEKFCLYFALFTHTANQSVSQSRGGDWVVQDRSSFNVLDEERGGGAADIRCDVMHYSIKNKSTR